MKRKQKQKHQPQEGYHWNSHALFALFLQVMGFIGFIGWCLEEHILLRFSLPPIMIGLLILSSLFLSQLAHARDDHDWWDDNNCSGWHGH